MKEITKAELKGILKDWQFLMKRLYDLRERQKAHCYTITPSYNPVGGCTLGGIETSKVERYYLVQAKIEEEIRDLEDKIVRTSSALAKARLTAREKMLIESIMDGRSLSGFAREKNIYISNVYKMRDKAINKIYYYL